MQHTATCCNTPQHTTIHSVWHSSHLLFCNATHCNTLQHTATNCNTQCVAAIASFFGDPRVCCSVLQLLQHIAVCCILLQCTAVCCSVLQFVAGCCSHCIYFFDILECVAACCRCCSMLQCAAVCCSVLLCVAVCCGLLQHPTSLIFYCLLRCVAVCCSVLQCVAVVLQCIAVLANHTLIVFSFFPFFLFYRCFATSPV